MNVPELLEPNDFDAILSNARTLRPWIAEKADVIEEQRCLPEEVVDALIQAGAFRMNMPRIWGGPQLTSMEQVLVIEELSRGDASVGWCVMIGCDSGIYSGYLDDATARNLYPHLDMVQAGWVYPVGRAEEVNGGYKVSGNWMFCSGSTHADMIAAGCTVYRNGEPVIGAAGLPEWRLVLAPKAHWQFTDVWHTTGLKGTASNDYTTVEDYLVVPREHTFSFLEPRREGELWQKPDTILRKMSGIPLGLSRRLIDDVVELMMGKTDRMGIPSYRNNARIQSAVADAELILGRARSYVYQSLDAQWRCLEQNTPLSKNERGDVWLSRLNAFQAAREIASMFYDTVGADAIYTKKSVLDRAIRDTNTMCQHVVGQKKGLEDVGALLLDAVDGPGSPML
jgi:alkylation response protein AidB-like acyl-CoA dehydrogenase